MNIEAFLALLFPFLGTALGSGCVFFMKKNMSPAAERNLNGFAAGVMVAASIWSLIIPAIDQAAALGSWAFFPAVGGFWGGIFFILLLERLVEALQSKKRKESSRNGGKGSVMLALAVTLHNLPEGIAVGVALAGWLSGDTAMSLSGVLILTVGIAVQNFPEGAIISMPLYAEGRGRLQAFLWGVLSGAVEPVGAIVTLWMAKFFSEILPYCLSFAAGAMFYVVIEELIPKIPEEKQTDIRILTFSLGFTLMLTLDVALG